MRNGSVTIVRLPKTTAETIQITILTNVTLQSKRIVNVDKDGAHTADVLLLFCNPSEDIQVGDFVIPGISQTLINELPDGTAKEQRALINNNLGRTVKSISNYQNTALNHMEVSC